MSIDIQTGPNLGLTFQTEPEAHRGRRYRTLYVTLWRLHLIASVRTG